MALKLIEAWGPSAAAGPCGDEVAQRAAVIESGLRTAALVTGSPVTPLSAAIRALRQLNAAVGEAKHAEVCPGAASQCTAAGASSDGRAMDLFGFCGSEDASAGDGLGEHEVNDERDTMVEQAVNDERYTLLEQEFNVERDAKGEFEGNFERDAFLEQEFNGGRDTKHEHGFNEERDTKVELEFNDERFEQGLSDERDTKVEQEFNEHDTKVEHEFNDERNSGARLAVDGEHGGGSCCCGSCGQQLLVGEPCEYCAGRWSWRSAKKKSKQGWTCRGWI